MRQGAELTSCQLWEQKDITKGRPKKKSKKREFGQKVGRYQTSEQNLNLNLFRERDIYLRRVVYPTSDQLLFPPFNLKHQKELEYLKSVFFNNSGPQA